MNQKAGPGLRQAMAGFHTWAGLVFGWGAFVVFLSGSLSVFDAAITHWMRRVPTVISTVPATQAERESALRLAQLHVARLPARDWRMRMPQHRGDAIVLQWDDAQENTHRASLSPEDGSVLPPSPVVATAGGHFFVVLHKQLHAGSTGIWLVGAIGMAMLVALISGIIIHKRIFQDFFTFRPRKGQRSWLDAHNAAAVLTLPFLLVITYTGLAIYYANYLPAGIRAWFPDAPAYYRALLADPPANKSHKSSRPPSAAPLRALAPLLAPAEQRLQGVVADVEVHSGGMEAQGATVTFSTRQGIDGDQRVLQWTAARLELDGADGAERAFSPAGWPTRGGTPMNAQRVMGTLHMVRFGDGVIRWLYFLSGLIGCAMIAAGSLLFVVKRRKKSLQEFGRHTAAVYRAVDILNVAVFAGMGLACLALLWANRLLPSLLDARAAWEVTVFFAAWGAALLHAAARPPQQAWREQLALMALLCLLLPAAGAVGAHDALPMQLARGDWRSAGVELTVLACGLGCLRVLGWLRRRAMS